VKLFLASEFPFSYPLILSMLEERKRTNNKVLFIPTAALGENYDALYEKTPFLENGYDLTIFDLAGQDEAAVAKALAGVDIIYMSGGNTFYLLHHIKKCNFAPLLRKKLEDGALYIGNSAGSIVCAPDIAYIDVMDNPAKAPELPDTKGLGLTPFGVVPHVESANEDNAKAAALRLANPAAPFPLLGLNDQQVLTANGNAFRIF